MRRWPRWRAFYRLQRALATGSPDEARETLLTWAVLRWAPPCLHLARLPCHRDPAMGALLDDLAPPPRLRRTVKTIARIAGSIRRRADMLLAEINRPPRA